MTRQAAIIQHCKTCDSTGSRDNFTLRLPASRYNTASNKSSAANKQIETHEDDNDVTGSLCSEGTAPAMTLCFNCEA
jgi:hypothetical protein